ncbi:MAG: sigma factor-like helix-turn-helix DNA-binding protein [Patescibacteria group bacterium]
MDFNYTQISSNLLRDLPSRVKEVVSRRFGLESGKEETLEAIGGDFGITRERIRQIEESGLEKIRPEIRKYQKVFDGFYEYLEKQGTLKRETILLEDLGREKYQPQIYFLLSLDNRFKRMSENDDFCPLWTTDKNNLTFAKKTIDFLFNKLKESKKPLSFKELKSFQPGVNDAVLNSYLEASKKIQKNAEGLYGLKDWPEINPRGIKDKAYLIFKKTGKPLHFTDVTKMINGALTQTVHNELIRDSRFVLVGRGIYALSEWGYTPGQVKDVLLRILKESKKPLTKEEILNLALKQRMVKENTILLNLSNKNYFTRNPQGKYTVRES